MPIFDTQSRDELRRVYIDAWRKHREGLPMEPLEAQVADVIALHPEYQAALERPDQVVERDYSPEGGQSNPFLHMGLHLAVRDQIATDRPQRHPAGLRLASPNAWDRRTTLNIGSSSAWPRPCGKRNGLAGRPTSRPTWSASKPWFAEVRACLTPAAVSQRARG